VPHCRATLVAAAGAVALVAAAAPTAAATSPSFGAPAELASARFGLAAAVATDGAGTTTLVITGSGAPKLLQRPAGGAWPAAARLPGDPRGMKGPVVAAAGLGALAIAWRVDTPRRYGGIRAEVRDPGGALSTPIEVAGEDAGGVRHPALAVDARGDALLAFNTDTRKQHLSLRGAIAVSYRPAHGPFAEPVVVDDAPSTAPVLALAADGTGIVAWTHSRRVYAVSIARGKLGKVKEVAASRGLGDAVVAAGPGGQAAIAWIRRAAGSRTSEVRAKSRGPGHAFAAERVLASARGPISDLALAADEQGRTTAAWTEDHLGRPGAVHPITTTVRAATAAPGGAFGKPRVIAPAGDRDRRSLSLAAAGGRVALAWGYKLDNRRVGVEAAVGPASDPGLARPVATSTLVSDFFVVPPPTWVTLVPSGAATVLGVLPAEPQPRQRADRLVAVDGR
jgi:hypothetical protein